MTIAQRIGRVGQQGWVFPRALGVLSRQAARAVLASVNHMGKSENGPLESQTDLGSSGCRLRRLWRDSGGTAAALACFGAPIRVRCVLWPDGRVGGLQGAASFLEHLWLASDSSGEQNYSSPVASSDFQ